MRANLTEVYIRVSPWACVTPAVELQWHRSDSSGSMFSSPTHTLLCIHYTWAWLMLTSGREGAGTDPLLFCTAAVVKREENLAHRGVD